MPKDIEVNDYTPSMLSIDQVRENYEKLDSPVRAPKTPERKLNIEMDAKSTLHAKQFFYTFKRKQISPIVEEKREYSDPGTITVQEFRDKISTLVELASPNAQVHYEETNPFIVNFGANNDLEYRDFFLDARGNVYLGQWTKGNLHREKEGNGFFLKTSDGSLYEGTWS